MKKIALVSLILLATTLSAKPVLKFKNQAFDFGEANAGAVLDIRFEFENAGTDMLKIDRVIPSCGCTATALAKKEYKPGEKGTITAKFNTSGYSGPVIKSITVTSNDPESPEIRLSLSGTVLVKDFAKADLKPAKIAFQEVRLGQAYSHSLNLSNLGTVDLRVVEVSHGPEVFLEFKANGLAPNKSSEIILHFTPFEKGTYNSMVKIRTNDTRSPYVFVRLEALVD